MREYACQRTQFNMIDFNIMPCHLLFIISYESIKIIHGSRQQYRISYNYIHLKKYSYNQKEISS